MDLSNELTTFVISSGNNPNYQSCLAALKQQSVQSKIDIIKDYHPMSKAFQEMLVRCKTPYYIEVDEDMVLNKNAVEIMYAGIKNSPKDIAMIGYQLHDTHFDFIIYGIKIYKYNIFKEYPYNLKSMSCEMEQLDRLQKGGYKYTLKLDILGEHSPLWTDESIFERYFNLMEKFKEFHYVWMETIPQKLCNKLLQVPTKQNLYAFLGAYTSIIKREKIQMGEKDFTKSKMSEFSRIESFLEPPNTSTFYMTSKCNFKCKYCKRQSQSMLNCKDMSLDLARGILTKFSTIKSVCVCGFGETLMCDNLIPILQYLKQRKIFVGLITNGSLLKFKLAAIKNYVNYISISLNMPNEQLHRDFSGTNTFNDVIEGIKMCVSSNVETYLSFICSKENLQHIPSFLQLARNLKVTTVHLHNLLPHFGDNDELFWKLVLTKQDEGLIKKLKADPNASIVSHFPILIDKNEIRRECKFPWRMLSFDGNGNISLCASVCEPKRENGNIGDYVLWQNDYCMNLRDSILGEQNKYCRRCFRNWEQN